MAKPVSILTKEQVDRQKESVTKMYKLILCIIMETQERQGHLKTKCMC